MSYVIVKLKKINNSISIGGRCVHAAMQSYDATA